MYMEEPPLPRPPLPPQLELPEHLRAKPGVPDADGRRDLQRLTQAARSQIQQFEAGRPMRSPGIPGSVGSVGFSFDGFEYPGAGTEDSFGDTGSFRDTHGSFRMSRTTQFSGSHGDFRETRSSTFSASDREVRAERSVRQQRTVPRSGSPTPQRRSDGRGTTPALFPDEVV